MTRWFGQEPILCFAIVACVCAAIWGLFHLDRQNGGGWISGDFDSDGEGGD